VDDGLDRGLGSETSMLDCSISEARIASSIIRSSSAAEVAWPRSTRGEADLEAGREFEADCVLAAALLAGRLFTGVPLCDREVN
jgi:hypothetical protein